MRHRIASIAIVLLLIASGLTVLASSGWTPQGITEKQTPFKAHALTVTDYTWKQTSGNLASTAGNWENGSVPVSSTSSYVYFTSLSTASCTWDLAINVGAFSMNTGYSGTVTQGASFSITSFTKSAGVCTFSSSYTITDSGDFLVSGGTLSDYNLKITMTGDGSTFSLYQANAIHTMTINANVTFTTPGSSVSNTFSIASGKTLTISAGGMTNIDTTTFNNLGMIAGAGTLTLKAKTDKSWNLGTINCPLVLKASSASSGSSIITLLSTVSLGSTLSISSEHATYTTTLDPSSSNYALSATDITIGTRGILNGRGSTITCSGNWDSSAGTFTQGTSSVHLTGTTKTLKTTGTSSFNKLFLDAGSSYTLQSNVITQQYWKNGTLSLGGYTLYVDQDQAPSITSTPSTTSFACNQQYAYTYAGSDREGENLTYGLTTNLLGLTLSSGNSTVWRHGAQHARGTFTMHLSVTDGNHTVWQNTTLTVTNLVSYFTSTPILSKAFDLDYSYDANATDPESFTITYGLSSTLGGLTVNSTTGIVSKAHYLGNGTFLVNVSASDGNYTVWQNYTLSILNQVPIVTSRPRMSVIIYNSYLYTPDGYDPENLSLVINVTTSAPWLTFNPNGTLSGSPLSRDAGSWLVNVSFWDGYRTTYDNYTIEVSILDAATTNIMTFILGLIFCFAFLFLGLRNPVFMMLAGIVWILVSLSIFITYGPLFLLVGLGVGFIGMIEGGLRYGN